MKPELKEGQIWYNPKSNRIIYLSSKDTVVFAETVRTVQTAMWVADRYCYMQTLLKEYNVKHKNWHYIGEL